MFLPGKVCLQEKVPLVQAEHFGQDIPALSAVRLPEPVAADFFTQREGAKILLKEVPDPKRFGVPEIDGDKIIVIEEKPENPKSNYAVIGIYFYDHHVFDVIRTLTPSTRNELEITDVNNHYIERGTLTWDVLEGWWTDAGTFDSLRRATNLVAETGANLIHFTPTEPEK